MYFWQIHWKPSLSVVRKISSSSRMTWMPLPRDLPEGLTIHALRPPLMWCCLLLPASSPSTAPACSTKCRPRGLSKAASGSPRGAGSAPASCSCFFFFFFSFLPSFSLSFSFCLFRSASLWASVGGSRLWIISSRSRSFGAPSFFRSTSSRTTCFSRAHSSEDTVQRPSASGGQSRTSSTSVTIRVQIFRAVCTTSLLKVAAAPVSMCWRNSLRMDSAFENL
mmetsp:Transcript_9808/g.30454  ORF Transcript_9808/g.30454 Transcript_9808/m.30454 type:complete len:222 (-) Transcript_9808:409-1074(-)